MKKLIQSLFFLSIVLIMGLLFTGASTGPGLNFNSGYTGAPFDNFGQYCNSCHGGGFFTPSVDIELLDGSTPVNVYNPGSPYTVKITVSSSTGVDPDTRYGFQVMAVDDATETDIDNWGPLQPEYHSVATGGRTYIEHSDRLISGVIEIPWTAPPMGTGDVSFYAAGNVVNFDFSSGGDNPEHSSLTVSEFNLPITWIYFKGKEIQGKVLLDWSTSGVVTGGHFEVEKSMDGKVFESFTTVSMNAPDNGKDQNYSVQDEKPFLKTYYRIKLVEPNGGGKYYKTITVNKGGGGTAFHYLQGDNIQLQIVNNHDGEATMAVYKIDGAKLNGKTVLLKSGFNSLHIQKPQTSGLYIIQLRTDNEILYSGKILID